MSKLWDEIADEWDGSATSSSTALVIVTGGAPTTPIPQPCRTSLGPAAEEGAVLSMAYADRPPTPYA
jgi:hypothetical protein